MSLSKTSFIFACIIPFASCAGTIAPAAQEPSNREAFGSLRATIMESLLRSVFPGSQFKWEPDLDVQDDKGNFVHAEFPALTIQPQTDGSILGASGIELAGEKEKIIFEARRFRSFPTRNLPTTVVVFKAGANGNVTLAHKVDLDPSEPLIEIKSLHVSDWPSGGRPLLQVRYISHAVSPDSDTAIEWQATLDSVSGKFLSHVPLGISTKYRTGGERLRMFAISRVNPGQVSITDSLNHESHPYSCADPCFVDGRTLMAEWTK